MTQKILAILLAVATFSLGFYLGYLNYKIKSDKKEKGITDVMDVSADLYNFVNNKYNVEGLDSSTRKFLRSLGGKLMNIK